MFQEGENKNVQFEEWQRPSNSYSSSKGSKFVQFIIKNSGGLIKNEKQANVVLIGIIILATVISLFLIGGGGSEETFFGNVEYNPPTKYEGQNFSDNFR